jgi:hypothetical protein
MAPLMQQLDQIRAQNQGIDEKDVMKFVAQAFDKNLVAVQEKTFVDFEVDESDVDMSTHHFLN